MGSLGELELASAVNRDGEASLLMLNVAEQSMQCLVVRRGRPVTFVSFPLPDDATEPLLVTRLKATIDRILHGLPAWIVAEGTPPIAVIGEKAGMVAAALRHIQDAKTFAIPRLKLGSLEAWGCVQQLATHPDGRIDFAKPKRGPDRAGEVRERRQRYALRGALIAILCFGLARLYVSQLEDQNQRLQGRLQQLTGELEQLEPEQESVRELIAWQARRLDWPAELTQLLGHLPSNERAYLRSIIIDHALGDVAELQLEGVARTLEDALAVNQSLLSDSPHYIVRPDQIQKREADAYYQTEFLVSAGLDPSGATPQSRNSEPVEGDAERGNPREQTGGEHESID